MQMSLWQPKEGIDARNGPFSVFRMDARIASYFPFFDLAPENVHSDAGKDPSETDVLRALLPVARKRKATGNPFNCLGVSSPSPEPVLIAGME